MQRRRALAGLLASVGLVAAIASPVAAEPPPPTLVIGTSVGHYLGGWYEQSIQLTVTCDGFGSQDVFVDLPGGSEDVLQLFGGVPAGTDCWVEIGGWPNPGDNADWESETWDPAAGITLADGANVIALHMTRIWADGWLPETDSGAEYLMDVTIDRVYLNGKGGIEVEGTSWCPDAVDLILGESEPLYAGVSWQAVQYVGRKTAIHAGYDSGIAHPCWDYDEPDHGPYAWQTRYAYPNGALQFVYAWDGKLGSGTIHLDAVSNAEMMTIEQNFAPDGWTSFEGEYVAYDADCEDNNGDGWCVTDHLWSGWAQADLKPIRVK